MVTKGTESSQGNGDSPPPQITTPAGPPPGPPPGPHDQRSSRAGNAVFKSGPLFISSKGIGWTSWKKRWFILTHTSLVFFRSDPSAIPQKGSEVNLILGGIDLNNSGSVVVKADKKLLTVLFPNGRDGRAFTLKAETLEDLYEWKTALENALAQAPSTAVMGQNGVLKNDQAEATNGSVDQSNNKPVKFTVIGRPILLALEDVDGTPSFLEKALRFIEEYGVKVEGVLRQAADVDDVERRIREFENGKTEFSPGEDAHIVADCIKYVIRELPSSPVPASCCNALLEARRTERGARVNAIRTAICETFPEPNRRLLQRILMMMQAVASHKTMNRMSTSAVAACMAPLLLRPLLSGECEIESDFDVGCDGSAQLLQAAAAANYAQAIVITLLEEYHNIFGEGSMSPGLYSDSEESGIGTEEATDDEESYEDDENDNATQGSDASMDDDLENASSGSCSESDGSGGSDLDENDFSSGSKSPETGDKSGVSQMFSSAQHDDIKKSEDIPDQSKNNLATQANESAELLGNISTETIPDDMLNSHGRVSCMQKSSTMSKGPPQGTRPRAANLGRTGARKNLSMESIDYPIEEEAEIQRLEANKADLQNRIANEVKGNEILQSSLEKRKKDLHERRLALEKDVARLQDQLQNERDKKTAIEAVLNSSQGPFCFPATIDEKTKVELEEIVQAESNVFNLKQKVDDLGLQLNQQLQKNYGPTGDSSNQLQQMSAKLKDKQRDTQTAATSYVSEKKDKQRDTQTAATSYASERKDKQRDTQTAATSYVSERKDKHRDTQTSATSYVSDGSTNKDSCPDELVVTENEKKRESTPDKNPPQNQQLDSIYHSSSRPSNSKKSGSKVEGSNSTASALTKLTNRLNFLKERRSQITSELQNLDKNRGSGQAGRRQDKGRGAEQQQSEGAEGQSTEKGRERDGFQSQQNMDKGPGMEGQSLENPSKLRKSNSHTPQNMEGDRRPEGQRQHSFERRAEGHLNYDGDRSRGAGGHPSRTLSR